MSDYSTRAKEQSSKEPESFERGLKEDVLFWGFFLFFYTRYENDHTQNVSCRRNHLIPLAFLTLLF